MSNPNEDEMIISPKPYKIKLADVMFIALKKHLMVFKDLTGSKYVHYTAFMNGSLIDFHETLEDKGRHIPLLKIEFDWQFLMQTLTQTLRANWASVFQIVKVNNPRWGDLEVEFIPIQVLVELLSPIHRGVRWNIDLGFLEKLEDSTETARLVDVSQSDLIIGTASQGRKSYFVLCNGIDCFLFDMSRMSKIIEKSFELSIKKIHLSYFTLSSILFYLRIRLFNLGYSTIKYLRKLKP